MPKFGDTILANIMLPNERMLITVDGDRIYSYCSWQVGYMVYQSEAWARENAQLMNDRTVISYLPLDFFEQVYPSMWEWPRLS